MDADSLPCSRCAAMVSPDELGLGLAVRINGEIVCPACVELLPKEAQLSINRVRAMKGLGATTYKVPHPHHSSHALFTFSTAGLINHHRRTLKEKGSFPTPPLPPSGVAATAPGSGAGRLALIGGGVAAAVVLAAGLGLWLANRPPAPFAAQAQQPATERPVAGADPALPTTLPAQPETPAAVTPDQTPATGQPPATGRDRFPADPLVAWLQARSERGCPAELVKTILDELRKQRIAQLDDADRMITELRFADALGQIGAMELPAAPELRDLQIRTDATRVRITAARERAKIEGLALPPPTPRPTETPTGSATAAESKPPEPAMPSGIESWWIAATDLDQPRAGGRIGRNLPAIAGGRYQIWAKVKTTHPQYPFVVELGQLKFDPVLGPGWVRCISGSADHFDLPAGELDLSVPDKASIFGIALLGTRFPSPTKPGNGLVPPPWPGQPAPGQPGQPAVPGQPVASTPPVELKPNPAPAVASTLSKIEPTLLNAVFPPGQEKGLVTDGTVWIPSPWPGRRFLRAQRDPSQRSVHRLSVTVPAESIGGSLGLLVHRGAAARKNLKIVADQSGKTLTLSDLPVTGDDWQPAVVDLTSLTPGASATLHLSDPDRLTDERSFFIAGAWSVAGRLATPAELPRLHPVLILPDVVTTLTVKQPFQKLFRQIASQRRILPAKFDLTLKVLVGGNLEGDWTTLARKEIEGWSGAIRNLQVAGFGVGQDWWSTSQISAEKPVVDPEVYSTVVFAPNGAEASLGGPDAVEKWAKTLCSQATASTRGNLLPVVAIGTTERDGPTDQVIEQMWSKALPALQAAGIPLLDLRTHAPRTQTVEGFRQVTAHLLGTGLRNLHHQVVIAAKPNR